MCIKAKKPDADLLRTPNTKAFRKTFLRRVLRGDELNLADRLSWNSEHCAQTKTETQLEATQAPMDSN